MMKTSPVRICCSFLLTIGLTSCANLSGNRTTPIYSGAPNYPKTVVALADGRYLEHRAGPLDSEGRHYIGAPEPGDFSSSWTLKSADGVTLLTAPSNLTDPAETGEFADYNRKNDLIYIYQSPTGKVVVIVEDRSPTSPNQNYYVLSRTSGGNWAYQQLQLEPYTPKNAPQENSPLWNHLYRVFPDILTVSDRGLSCTAAHGTRWITF